MKKEGEFYTEVIHSVSDEAVTTILSLEPLFPIKIQDTKETIIENLENPENINIFLKNGRKVVGYILAVPHNDVFNELKDDDPGMRVDDERYYVDKIVMLPEYREGTEFTRLVYAFFDESIRRGFNKFSTHVLADNKLNRIIKRIFGKILTEERKVNLAIHGNALYEYLEGIVLENNNETNSTDRIK